MEKMPDGWKWVKDGGETLLTREKYWGTEKKKDTVKVNRKKTVLSKTNDAAGVRMTIVRAKPKPKIRKYVPAEVVRANPRKYLQHS